MDIKMFNRREFLKRFALLSSAPIAISFCGCPASVYGPPPVDEISPRVDGMHIHDPQTGDGILNGKTDVPIDASFEVEFTKQMDPSSINAIHLQCDDDNTQIAIKGSWLTGRIALIKPNAHLNLGGGYILSVDEAAMDVYGNPIDLTEIPCANFHTK